MAGLKLPIWTALFLVLFLAIEISAQQENNKTEDKELFKGPFKSILKSTDNVFIYPTNITDTSLQRRVLHYLKKIAKRGNDVEVISDTSALKRDLSSKNVLAIGTYESNIWLENSRNYHPFIVTADSVVTDTIFKRHNLLLTSCLPNYENPAYGHFLIIGQNDSSLLNIESNHDFWYNDWMLIGEKSAIAAGNYVKSEAKWKIEPYKSIDVSHNAKWIWYPGDFAIELNKRTSMLRKERNQPYPPLWRVDEPYGKVYLFKKINISRPETISVSADVDFTIMLDGYRLNDFNPEAIKIPVGFHYLSAEVINYNSLPSILIKGKTIISDTSWGISFGGRYDLLKPGSWYFDDPQKPPSSYRLMEKLIPPVSIRISDTSLLADFGTETFGRLILKNVKGKGRIYIYYGETLDEAKAQKKAETWEFIDVFHDLPTNDTLKVPMAFRYVYVLPDKNITVKNLSHLYEYRPLNEIGTFNCSDTTLNKIFEVSSRTLILNTRELLFDGIKRDRWCWSGDALIGCLLNYYHYFDEDIVRHSLSALRGHDPVIRHINTIPDYSLYWFISIYNHFLFTADTAYIEDNFEKMKGLMDYCLGRCSPEGFLEVDWNTDWVFIDWTSLPRYGQISIEQLLLWRSLDIMSHFSNLLDKKEDYAKYDSLAQNLKSNINKKFWNNDPGALTHHWADTINDNRVSEEYDPTFITRYSNFYGINFNFFDDKQKQSVLNKVLLNDSIQEVKAPFHRIFEMEALCSLGKTEYAIDKMKNYWNGMLNLGATTFWEDYDKEQEGLAHYRWGRPFGKSLCHIWGGSPIYLIVKYIMGISLTEPGYNNYIVEPNLAGLDWFSGTVPVKNGKIDIYMDTEKIQFKSSIENGSLRLTSGKKPITSYGKAKKIGQNYYEIEIEKDKEYVISY